jgi:hypothetical protein
MAIGKVYNVAEAQRLKYRAKLLRDPEEAEIAKKVADEFLALPVKPAVGTGGELVLVGEQAVDFPGVVDTVQNPDKTTQRASMERINLAEEAGAFELSFDMAETIQARDSIEKALAHQMAAAHVHAMKLLAESEKQRLPVERARLANTAARLMTAYQDGAATLAKLRSGGKQQVTVVHQHVQVAGGQVAVTGAIEQPNAAREGVIGGGRSENAG